MLKINYLPTISQERKLAEQQIKSLMPRFCSCYSIGPKHLILSEYNIDLREYYAKNKDEIRSIAQANNLEIEEITAVYERNVGTEITIKFKL